MHNFYQFDIENSENFDYIIGLDEAGRGAIAGPLFVTAFTFFNYSTIKDLPELNDSKKLSFKKRLKTFQKLHSLKKDKKCDFCFFKASSQNIDKTQNISEVTSNIMIKSIKKQISNINKNKKKN